MSGRAAIAHLKLSVPKAVVEIARKLEDAGFETWCVGGAVRDALLGLRRADWDLATAARPDRVRRLFRRTYPIGVEFGTVGVRGGDGVVYEVTSFRRDMATDGRRAVIEYADTIEEDLARRDFTINAIAYHPLRHELKDPFGGLRDLERRVLRAVGHPLTRFEEDYLRILRGLRFAGRFDMTIEPGTWTALRERVPRLVRLSGERVREELLKVVADPQPSRALNLYRGASALLVVYPEIQVPDEEWERLVAAVDAARRSRPFLRIVMLFTAVSSLDALEEMMRRLRFSNAESDRALTLKAAHAVDLPDPSDARAVRRWLGRVGTEAVRDTVRLHAASVRGRGGDIAAFARVARAALTTLRQRPPLTLAELAIDGDDLKEFGLQPGPQFAEILKDCLERVIDDPGMNTRERLLQYVSERWTGPRG
ncbi:MAG: CCA tRNA nucleotidyltransferase [Gemmatimonadetes bacterium]|nr:CCA tRNA nucleotidyltransferase [Gemmatimonadota bacterium]